MSFLSQLKEAFSSDSSSHPTASRTDSDPAIEKLRQDVRQAETTNRSPALAGAWTEIQQFRTEHPDKVSNMTEALKRDALLPQVEIMYMEHQGLAKFGTTEQHPINDRINETQMMQARSADPFEAALLAGLQKDFQHYTNTGGEITRMHIENELLNGMVHNPDFYPHMQDPT